MSNTVQLQRPRGQARDIRSMLEAPRTVALMKALVPSHLSPDRMLKLAAIACQKTPKLLECNPTSLLGAFLSCSGLGLEPNSALQHVHLIPFGSDVQIVIGYRGYLELGRRSGLIKAVHADVVYPTHDFDYEFGTNTFLKHKPTDYEGEAGDYTHAYCHVQLVDGQAFAVMPKSAVLRIRDRSQNYIRGKNKPDNPWNAYPDRMARKTVIRQLYAGGEVPVSLNLANAMALDERKVDFAALADGSAEEIRENMGAFAQETDETPVAHDEDGVVTEPPQVENQRQEPAPQVQAQDDGREKDPAKPRGKKPAGDDDDTAALFNR